MKAHWMNKLDAFTFEKGEEFDFITEFVNTKRYEGTSDNYFPANVNGKISAVSWYRDTVTGNEVYVSFYYD